MGWGSLREYLPCIMDYHAESYHRSEQLDLCSTQKRCLTLSCFWSRQLRWTTVPRRINPARQLITARSWATVVSTIQNITVLQPSISILERYLSRSEYDRVKEGGRIALEIRTVWKYSLYPISHKISTGKRQLTYPPSVPCFSLVLHLHVQRLYGKHCTEEFHACWSI